MRRLRAGAFVWGLLAIGCTLRGQGRPSFTALVQGDSAQDSTHLGARRVPEELLGVLLRLELLRSGLL